MRLMRLMRLMAGDRRRARPPRARGDDRNEKGRAAVRRTGERRLAARLAPAA